MTEPAEPKRGPSRIGIGAAIAAAEARQRRSMLRNHGGGHAPVTQLELFFDLVFVFAITQLSHSLLSDLTVRGALQIAVLFGAVWWLWMWTTWATNWLEPQRVEVRLMLGTLMFLSLVLAAAIPYAFASGGLVLASAYTASQIGRCLFVSWAMERDKRGAGRNMLRASCWFTAAAPLWVAGALASDTDVRLGFWIAALALEYTGPLVMLWVPGLGKSHSDEWLISGAHMAERCGLFIIIALGEGLIITGATYARSDAQQWLDAALLTAFAGSFAMWWLYFDMGAIRGADHIQRHRLPGLVARQAFTYWHIPIVAGIVVLAVADEMLLAHPAEAIHAEMLIVVIGGAFLFIGGLAGFKRISSGNPWYPTSHRIGIYALVPIAAWGWWAHPSGLALMIVLVALFTGIAVWEWVSFHGGWLERMEQRDWRLARILRRRIERRRAELLAKPVR